MDFTQLAAYGKERNASDIHLSPGLPPLIRTVGDLKEVHVAVLTSDDIKKIIYSITNPAQQKAYEEELEIDFSFSVPSIARFRVNAYHTANGASAAFRYIPNKVVTLAELNAPAIFRNFTKLPRGLVLVTGPTGSGKSTTLAAMIDAINDEDPSHIITIEDPIEFVHKSKKALINQRELGTNTHSFAKALKSSLRQDPDVVLVGELRDLETIHLALTAAETGHLVFGTLHTNSAAKTIDRIIDVFPGEDKPMIRTMLASSVQAIIAQTLLKRKDGSGRVAAYEILVATDSVRNLIRENKIPQISSMIQIGSKSGMVLMEDYIKGLVSQGAVALEDVIDLITKAGDIKNASNVQQGASGNNTSPQSIQPKIQKVEEDF